MTILYLLLIHMNIIGYTHNHRCLIMHIYQNTLLHAAWSNPNPKQAI